MRIGRVLVANRGEIAVRVTRAARKLGIEAVALSGSTPADYLDIDGVVAAAADKGCDAVHPGYGFLSENATFARRCVETGLTWIGPRPELLDLFGDKTAARRLAAENGVPILAGTSGPTTLEEARAFVDAHGAVMVKAVSGGGGRGMRVVRSPQELDPAFERCRSEALQAF